MSGDFRWLAVNTRVHTYYPMRTRGCGCIGRPAFPTPSVFRAEINCKPRTHRAARSRTCICICRHCEERSDEAIHSFFLLYGLLRFARNDVSHSPLSSSAKAGDRVLRDANDGIDKPQRTGYSAFAEYDDLLGESEAKRSSFLCGYGLLRGASAPPQLSAFSRCEYARQQCESGSCW